MKNTKDNQISNCCEKCRGIFILSGFDKYFSLNDNGDLVLNFTDDTSIPKDDKQLLKSFISTLLLKNTAKTREEVVNDLKQIIAKDTTDRKALDEVIDYINKLNK